ncbi:MBL fold metallo-hydrolase [Cohnella nanjingensis]|uniref:MBL fold metallo-hydrolase n=1 Tax=Cohnella nanjingensis TaxID=1387779 RepID=A0A7X0S0N6_9BACL|nr:MBL fold metallo-hydrolase [Cohnella nanjingensis]MBB6675514.1 MBL fold metallo-hydrolase [Cohnella nanjingensis]
MKLTRISDHIWSLRLWMIIPVQVWLVKDKDGITLVDAGIPMMAKGILRGIEQLQAGPLRQIALTHGHADHVGGLPRILETNPVPVHAHRIEIPYIEGELPYRAGKRTVAVLPKGATVALREENPGQLSPIGSLTPYFTPGHSPGHVVYYHEEDRVLLAGDLFASRRGRLRKPLFTPDMTEVLRSSAVVGTLKPVRLEVCHGGGVLRAADQLEAYIAKEAKSHAGKAKLGARPPR